ncbi:MAG: hypothetical protein ACXAEX_20085 [Promethearchaeota archaeon]|jgi:hypothetical protein
MIFQGLFNILDLYFSDIDLLYNNIDHYFQDKIIKSFGNIPIDKSDMNQEFNKIMAFLIEVFEDLGFDSNEIEPKHSDPHLVNQKDDFNFAYTPLELYEKKLAPIIYELFLEKIVDYLVDIEVAPLMLRLKDEGFLPIEFIMELRNLKNLINRYPQKRENLRKYTQIKKNIINKFQVNKENIESLEDVEEPEYKLQIIYLIYRIIHFFDLQKMFDFSHIKSYLQENSDEWLVDVPMVSLKNPDIYFCGIYLAKHLGVELNNDKIKEFLLELNYEATDRYECPLIEATDGAYYFFKSTELMRMFLDVEQFKGLIKTLPKYLESSYLKTLETSQLVVILKLFRQLGIKKMDNERNAITEEIERRISPEGIKQFREGFVSSEATYYVLFSHFMNNTLDKLKDYEILKNIVSRIYRNIELLDFSVDTNFDLISELFYSLESLKLFNCIETKEMIIHLAKYLFPQEVVEKISTSKELIRKKAKFRHLKVNKITGETIY